MIYFSVTALVDSRQSRAPTTSGALPTYADIPGVLARVEDIAADAAELLVGASLPFCTSLGPEMIQLPAPSLRKTVSAFGK
jgi:hypothetical protein